MVRTELTVDVLWRSFLTLPQASRDQFIEKMVADSAVRRELEDLLDLAMAGERAREPVRSLDDVLSEIDGT